MTDRPLTLISTEGGCAAKLGPSDLRYILDDLVIQDPVALQIIQHNDDAGVFTIGNETIVQSVDVITPICDDPYTFGSIAVTHALSDIYAVGANPLTALFFLGIPKGLISLDVSRSIVQGGIDKLYELGCNLMGGHTIETKQQVFFGISATGVLDSRNKIENRSKVGDVLLLTKPLGTGIISTALKFKNGGTAIEGFSDLYVENALRTMLIANSKASKICFDIGINACTDVTGFGLIGHLCQLLTKSNVSANLNIANIPILDGIAEFSQQGIFPAGCDRNLAYWEDKVIFPKSINLNQIMTLFDPQTSGGLLFSVSKENLTEILNSFSAAGLQLPSVIGETIHQQPFLINF